MLLKRGGTSGRASGRSPARTSCEAVSEPTYLCSSGAGQSAGRANVSSRRSASSLRSRQAGFSPSARDSALSLVASLPVFEEVDCRSQLQGAPVFVLHLGHEALHECLRLGRHVVDLLVRLLGKAVRVGLAIIHEGLGILHEGVTSHPVDEAVRHCPGERTIVVIEKLILPLDHPEALEKVGCLLDPNPSGNDAHLANHFCNGGQAGCG